MRRPGVRRLCGALALALAPTLAAPAGAATLSVTNTRSDSVRVFLISAPTVGSVHTSSVHMKGGRWIARRGRRSSRPPQAPREQCPIPP